MPNNASGMRPIELQFLGLEIGTYAALCRKVIKKGEALLGSQFSWQKSCAREYVLNQMMKSNFLVNCSLKESFSCVSVEAMALGLPLLRMQNGGFEEQLVPDETGFDLGCPSPEIRPEQVQLINSLRDPEAWPESRLLEMTSAARVRGRQFAEIKYEDWLL